MMFAMEKLEWCGYPMMHLRALHSAHWSITATFVFTKSSTVTERPHDVRCR